MEKINNNDINFDLIDEVQKKALIIYNQFKNYNFGKMCRIIKKEYYKFPPLSVRITYDIILDSSSKDEIKNLRNYLTSLDAEYFVLGFRYIPFKIGDKFQYENIEVDENSKIITFNENVIYILDFIVILDHYPSKEQKQTHKIFELRKKDWFQKVKLIIFIMDNNYFYHEDLKIPNYFEIYRLNNSSQFDNKIPAGLNIVLNKKKIIKYAGVSFNYDIEKTIDNLLKNDNYELELLPFYSDSYIKPINDYYNQIRAMKNFILNIQPYTIQKVPIKKQIPSLEKFPTIYFEFSFERRGFEFVYTDNCLSYGIPCTNFSVVEKVIDMNKIIEKEKFNPFCTIYCKVNYLEEGCIFPKKDQKCSNCLINFIGSDEEYAVCYLCSTEQKCYYLCKTCIKYLINEGENSMHEHPLLLVQKGGIKYLKKIKDFPINQAYYENKIHMNYMCTFCRDDNCYYIWRCCLCQFELCKKCMKLLRNRKKKIRDSSIYEHIDHPFFRIRKGWVLEKEFIFSNENKQNSSLYII